MNFWTFDWISLGEALFWFSAAVNLIFITAVACKYYDYKLEKEKEKYNLVKMMGNKKYGKN